MLVYVSKVIYYFYDPVLQEIMFPQFSTNLYKSQM